LGPENSVSILGSFLTEKYELFKNIIKNKCDVRIILDSDAKSKQDKIADLLYEYGINVTTIDLDNNCDVADMYLKDKTFKSLLENEYPWERRTSILSRIDMIVTGSY
jgi:NTP pyrophosphatase (non-canonical NTP hydrolase)